MNIEYYTSYMRTIQEKILNLNLPQELKAGLCEVNNLLFNYSRKINIDKIKSRVSFYFNLKNLNYRERKIIENTIITMFKFYDLSNGNYKYFDVSTENPIYILENIEKNDFWSIDFLNYEHGNFYNAFISKIKKVCRNQIKCIFFYTTSKLISESKSLIEEEKSEYLNCKYNYDYTFEISNCHLVCEDLKENLTENGYKCEFDKKYINDINDYKENEIYIESALIKNNILKKNNLITFNDLNLSIDTEKYTKLNEMIGLNNVKDELKKMENIFTV